VDEAYHTLRHEPSPKCLEIRDARHDTVAGVAEETASTLFLADLLCGPAGNLSGLRRIGDKWVGICPLPECASRLPSFAVWRDTDVWRCFTCMRGGRATDLARLVGHALVAKARGK
jgi:CHC2 zinc finger